MHNRTVNDSNGLSALHVVMCYPAIICRRLVVVHYGVVSLMLMLSVVLCGIATAADSSRSNALSSIYEFSGVHSHLSSVYATVIDESQLIWQECDNAHNNSATEHMLRENLSIDVLDQDFLDQLDQRISDEHLAQIVSWTQSDAGKTIHQAELKSSELDEVSFESLLKAYQQSKIHGDERNARLRQMLADTGAVYFLSALNTELSALVSIASVCARNNESVNAAKRQIKEDRSAEALYRSFMRRDLLIASAVVYRNISDAHIDALIAFANSEAGDAYFTGLIKGTRSLLASKVDRLSEITETMREEMD